MRKLKSFLFVVFFSSLLISCSNHTKSVLINKKEITVNEKFVAIISNLDNERIKTFIDPNDKVFEFTYKNTAYVIYHNPKFKKSYISIPRANILQPLSLKDFKTIESVLQQH